jgi:RNA polymerase sigma-70 factor (ECF subfamily)
MRPPVQHKNATRPVFSPRFSERQVIELPIPSAEAALVAALQAGRAEARKALFDRYGHDVERILYRVLGPDAEASDLLHDVFVVALGSVGTLRDPSALPGWLRGIAVNKARKHILRKQRWRFIQFFAPSDVPEREALLPSAEVSEALRATYAVLSAMAADERVAFALRFIDGMELTQVAAACGVSLATIKRRLGRAQQTFNALAAREPALSEWLRVNDGEGVAP